MADSKTPALVFLHAYGTRQKGDIVVDAASVATIRREVPPSFYVLTPLNAPLETMQHGEEQAR